MPRGSKKFKRDPVATISSFSKNLLGLKFMQRAKKEVEKAAIEQREPFDLKVDAKIKNKHQYIINHSYQFCEKLRFGRFSFKGMNHDVEAIMYKNKLETESHAEKRPASSSSDTSSDNEIDDLHTEPEDNINDDAEELNKDL